MSLEKCPTCNRWVGDGTRLGLGGYAMEYPDCPESKLQMKILQQLQDIFHKATIISWG